ncbi:MAG: class I poly(R)-hydroxyalkanoic acid synthase [Betaproteobacteria bacterium]|nr:class I poly(R)-hydroxyalkanoic acid synthase [Betaproteobacteria bacterium]
MKTKKTAAATAKPGAKPRSKAASRATGTATKAGIKAAKAATEAAAAAAGVEPTVAAPGAAADTPPPFAAPFGDIWRSMSGLSLPMERLAALQGDYLKSAGELWNQSLAAAGASAGDGAAAPAAPTLADRRFAGAEWLKNPAAAFNAQLYLLNARTLMQMAESVEGDAKTRARVRFAVQQWIDAASPSNYLALNPEALGKALATRGESIATGMQHLLEDVQKGHVSQTDESVFEVGRNVATTEGAVVFENELFQLIEYKPLTAKVHERPVIFVPPCINKYYILDLQPDNSLVRHTVEQGHRLFVVSWRNPDESLAAKTWDDYIEDGAITAIRTVQAISGAATINALGFCVGGTILATALAVLAARGARLGQPDAAEYQPAASVTLLTTLLDFSDTGILDIFVDEASVRLREMTIGAESPRGPGLLRGKELATTFSFLRPNDLVWNYVVGNYLKGEAPPPFDLLYWNGDSTNLPGPMYCWYLRHTYLQDELKVPGRLTVCGEKVDLGRIAAPVFVYASREDHIVPWDAAYRSVALFKRRAGARGRAVTFVLGASGHIAGVINPPAKGKRSHWVNAQLPEEPQGWLQGASERPGSWWPVWTEWLAGHAGGDVPAPKGYGTRDFKVIEPAPGRYVKAKA